MLSTHREPTKSDTQRLPSFQRIISETDQPKSPFSSSLDPLPSTTISRLARHESFSRQRATLCLSSTRSRVRTEISFRGSDDPCLCSLSGKKTQSMLAVTSIVICSMKSKSFKGIIERWWILRWG